MGHLLGFPPTLSLKMTDKMDSETRSRSGPDSESRKDEESPRNILFIFTDQQHRYALGCIGTPDIQTPHLDALAGEGVLFRNAYSACPICSPFRVNLFSGMYASQTGAFRNGCRIPEDCTPLAETLNQAGYQTSYVGKWHIGATGNRPIPEELQGGFQHFLGYQCYNGFYGDVVFYDKEGEAHEYEGHRSDVTTKLAIEQLEALAKETPSKPFALFVSYQAPHYPVQPAPEYAAMYEGVDIQRRINSQEIDPYTGTHSPPSPKPPELDPDFQRYGNDLGEYLRLYYAMVSQVDAGIGRLLKTIDRLGLTENTVVIFTSDHGDMQGSHGLKNKSKPQEESTGIPLIVSVPGGARGLVTEALVSGVDLYPTLVDYAGLTPPENLPGISFAPLTMREPQVLEGPVFSEMQDWKMVRRGNLKLVTRGSSYIPSQCYDLAQDPFEMQNLVSEESYRDAIVELREVLNETFQNFHVSEWLGATIKNAGGEVHEVTFSTVPKDSPARFFGFQSHDTILRVGEEPITRVSDFLARVEQLSEQELDIIVTIRRGDAEIEVRV